MRRRCSNRRCATPDQPPPQEPLRFADILTTGSAVADYKGESDVSAEHVLAAIEMLRGTLTLEGLGRPVSPLVPRPQSRGTEARLRDLVQRWWREVGEDVNAELDSAGVDRLVGELRGLDD